MISEIESLMNVYSKWIQESTSLREINGWVEITTPYLDRHNDCIQIYARSNGTKIEMTDEGYVIQDLEYSGLNLDTAGRSDALKTTLAGFGVRLNGKALETEASANDFALRKHNFVQAMLAINNLFYLASPIAPSVFYDEVSSWSNLAKVRYTENVKFTGKSGFDHRFDFVIPRSDIEPERILRAINRPTRDATHSLIFAYVDVMDSRPSDTKAFAVVNDRNNEVSAKAIEAMRHYNVYPIIWSSREQDLASLAA